MTREETARVALRRLAQSADGAPSPGPSGAESTTRPHPTDNGSPGSDERPSTTGSWELERRTDEGTDAASDVVGRAIAAVDDLDAAARFVEGGGVEELATALADPRSPVSGPDAEDGIDALRAFCAYERAAARDHPERSTSTEALARPETGTDEDLRDGTAGASTAESAEGFGTSTHPSTSAEDSPTI